MIENVRNFEVADPFGRTWKAQFRWQQNAITIRHADAIDVKYYLDNGEERREMAIALPHPALIALSGRTGREITDPWVMHLAAAHLQYVLSTWDDAERPLVTLTTDELERAAAAVDAESKKRAELARLSH
jgi:hypothetical protein